MSLLFVYGSLNQGFSCVEIPVERFDAPHPERLQAFVYLKQEPFIPTGIQRIGPLAEYKPEHTARFFWQGAV